MWLHRFSFALGMVEKLYLLVGAVVAPMVVLYSCVTSMPLWMLCSSYWLSVSTDRSPVSSRGVARIARIDMIIMARGQLCGIPLLRLWSCPRVVLKLL